MEMNSKGKERKENWGLLFTSPLRDETFQAVAVQQRPRTKSVMHVQIKLLFCSFKPIVAHGLFCRHCICLSSLLFEGPPTTSVLRAVQRNTLTAYRKTFHTVRRAIEWPQNSYRTFSWSLQKFHITFRSWLKLFAFLPTTFFETAVYSCI